MRKRRRVQGYTDMGKPRVPPFPPRLILKDRSTGTEYLLTHSGSAGSLTVTLSASLPSTPDVLRFDVYDGPYLSDNVRLYVSGGTLSAEFAAGASQGIRGLRVLTRKGWERTMVELTVPDGWEEGDALTETEITI